MFPPVTYGATREESAANMKQRLQKLVDSMTNGSGLYVEEVEITPKSGEGGSSFHTVDDM